MQISQSSYQNLEKLTRFQRFPNGSLPEDSAHFQSIFNRNFPKPMRIDKLTGYSEKIRYESVVREKASKEVILVGFSRETMTREYTKFRADNFLAQK